MPGRKNNAVVVDVCTRRIRALEGYVDGKTTMALNGRKLAFAEVLAVYQGCLDSRAELATRRAATKAAMSKRETAEALRREIDRALKAWVANEFGAESKEAIEFGFPPARQPVLTVEGKALAVARAKATREARHTMGRKQKEAIKGTVAAPAPITHDEGALAPTIEVALPA